ncbi:MAG: hypothetical protein AAGH15_24830, partial [Myxococcota bacterium]
MAKSIFKFDLCHDALAAAPGPMSSLGGSSRSGRGALNDLSAPSARPEHAACRHHEVFMLNR